MAKSDILVRFGADTKALKKAMSGIKSDAVEFGAFLGKSFGVAGAAATAAGVGVNALVSDLALLGKEAESLGLSVERLEEMAYAAGQISKLTKDDFIDVMQTMSEQVGDAVREAGSMRDAFELIGIAASDLAEMDLETQFQTIVNGLRQVENESVQASIATEIFEDKWRDVILIANAGASEFNRLALEARAMGTATDESAAAAAELDAELTKLSTQISSLTNVYGPPLISFLSESLSLFDRMKESVSGGMTESLEELQERLAILNGEDQSLWAKYLRYWLSEDELAKEISGVTKQIRELTAARDKLNNKPAEPKSDIPANKLDGTQDEKKKQDAAKKTTETKKKESDKQVRDTRSIVEAEGDYWNAEHDLISSLQDKNATAVEKARERMNKAVSDMESAGARDFVVKYYEDRASVSDADVLPEITFAPVVDQAGLDAMPAKIQEALNAANITVTVQPILADGGTASLERTAAQEGHDES